MPTVKTPKVVIRSLEGGKGPRGSGATGIAAMKDGVVL